MAVHGLVALALVGVRPEPPRIHEPEAFTVALVEMPTFAPEPPPPPPPEPEPEPSAERESAPAATAPRPKPAVAAPRREERPIPPPPEIKPLPVSVSEAEEPPALLSEAELAGALTAGPGAGGGGGGLGTGGGGYGGDGGRPCDMVRRLQAALRKDPEVRAAVAKAHQEAQAGGKALLVWNGDWIRNPGQDGKGLAGLRQAIIMEVGFAPEACRREPVRGFVLISMSEAPGGARLALGTGAWKWSDLLFAPSTASSGRVLRR